MTYIIAEPCVGLKDGACIDVCPVDCIYTRPEDNQMFINPDECIDCAACEPVCPVAAIFVEDQVPEKWASFTPLNYDYFKDKNLDDLKEATRIAPRKLQG
ncbi:MAG: 4Fe-4S binding protein [Chloroflexi bacterium]|nr:4Fe-4S binding protein [Chloroflexota bacterium]